MSVTDLEKWKSKKWKQKEEISRPDHPYDSERKLYKEAFSHLFTAQMQVLAQVQEVPFWIGQGLAVQREMVLAQALRMTFRKREIPFLPVVSLKSDQLLKIFVRQITYAGRHCRISLGRSGTILEPCRNIPDYFIYGVECDMRFVDPKVYRPLTVSELVAYCIHRPIARNGWELCAEKAEFAFPNGEKHPLAINFSSGQPTLGIRSRIFEGAIPCCRII